MMMRQKKDIKYKRKDKNGQYPKWRGAGQNAREVEF